MLTTFRLAADKSSALEYCTINDLSDYIHIQWIPELRIKRISGF